MLDVLSSLLFRGAEEAIALKDSMPCLMTLLSGHVEQMLACPIATQNAL